MAITASEARKNLFPLLAQVNNDRAPVEIMSRHGDAVLISLEEYEALEETAHPLRHAFVGCWSRRISEEHRLVYLVDGEDLVILQARYHYT